MRLFILLFLLPISVLAQSLNVKTYIPPQAYQYIPIVKSEVKKYFTDFEYDYYFMALAEHESCISLKHSRCLNSYAQLKSDRELGVGLGQLTKTFNTDGSIRFDSLTDLVRAHKQELRELSWGNIRTRPDLQLRAMIIMSRDNYNALYDIRDKKQRAIMMDPPYNGGLRDLRKSRMICGLAKNCDPNVWFGNVEKYCVKSRKPLYGGRSACDINTHHVEDVIHNRMPKYKKAFAEN